MEVSYLPDAQNHRLWPDLYNLLKPAAERGDAEVLTPNELVWIAYENGVIYAAATTIPWDDGEFELRLASGTRHREWMGLLDKAVSDWAQMNGADRLIARGRKGWARYARAFGWVALGHDGEMHKYEKDLRGGKQA